MIRQSLITLSVISLLSGCASWFTGSDVNAPTELKPIQNPAKLSVMWQTSVPSAKYGLFTPAYQAGGLWVAGNDNQLVQVNALTGQKSASVKLNTNSDLISGVGASDTLTFVGNQKGQILALDANGKTIWQQNLTSTLSIPPQANNEVVVARTEDGRITAFSTQDGKVLWTQSIVQPALVVQPSTSNMAILGDDILITGTSGGRIIVYNLKTGAPLWDAVVATPLGGSELERATDVISRPEFDGQRVCAVAYQGRTACFDARGGGLLWARDVGSSKGLAIGSNAVYVTAEDGTIWAFDINSGRNLWQNTDLKYRNVTAPVITGNKLLVADAEGYAHLLDEQTGQIVARVKTGAEGNLSQPIKVGQLVYVLGTNGQLVALNN